MKNENEISCQCSSDPALHDHVVKLWNKPICFHESD